MSQRLSGYARKPEDFYETPPWVTHALRPYMQGIFRVWDPASGKLSMSNVIATWGVKVRATDIAGGNDFLLEQDGGYHDAIICNPPYTVAQEFVEHALKLMKKNRGRVAVLLRTDFDHAKSRRHLFGNCNEFAIKLVLTSRIRWFAESKGSPSFNHAWFIWDHTHVGPPKIRYHYESDTLTERAERIRELDR